MAVRRMSSARDGEVLLAELPRGLGPVPATPHERGAVGHHHAVVAVKPRLELLHRVQPNDLGPVDAQELRRVEPLGQRAELARSVKTVPPL